MTSKNAPCTCGSKLKAKHCCLTNKRLASIPAAYTTGQLTSSEKVMECIRRLQKEFPTHRILDITDALNEDTYKPFQIANFREKTIMIAEKTEGNAGVFATRVDSLLSDILVMYHGSYRSFAFGNIDVGMIFETVCDMIH